jgi:hypothetical protein
MGSPSGMGNVPDAVDMGTVVRVAGDVFDSGLRLLLVFEAEQKSGRKQKFACVLEENVMMDLVDCLTEVADARSKISVFIKQLPQKFIKAVDESRNG